MGNSYAGQLKTTRFEEVLHNSIEASLRSSSLVPRPVFSQLYLEAEQQLSALEGGSRVDNEEEEEEGEGALEQNCPPNPYQMHPPPEGCCTTDGFCQAGKDLRLVSISSEPIDVPAGFLLVGAKSPSLPDHLLVCAVDKRFLPDDNGHNALLGFSGNCVGCGKKGFCYFTEFSNHINLKLTTQPKKQKHLKYYLVRNAQGALTKGPLICWKGSEFRSRQTPASTCSSSLFPPLESSGPLATFSSEPIPGTNPSVPMGAQQAGPASDHPSLTAAVGPAVFNGRDSAKHPQLVKNNLSAVPRPSALGILSNSGPPKKRHKGWSPESPSATDSSYPQGGGNRAKYESAGVSCMPQVGLVGPASVTLPVVASGEPVSVPDNLLKICKAKPVIFKGHGNFPYLCGNLNDVVVSPLLYTCYQNSQSISRAYEQYGASTIQPISEEMQLLLTVYYLVQLAADQVPLMEDLEQIFLRSWRESHLTEIRQYQQAPPQPCPPAPGAVAPVTSAQLPWLAGLAASSCNDSVHIIECTYSLAEGLSEMFRLLIEGKLAKTNYVVIICACRNAAIDSCIAVTGKYQARILSESLLTPAEYQKEVDYELVTGKVDSLGAFFSTLCPEGDIDILLDKFHQENQGHISSSLTASSVTKSASLDVSGVPVCTSYNLEPHCIRPFQLAVAQKLLSHVCSIADSSTQNLDLGSFEKVDFLICIPPSEVTYQQTLFHVWHSGVLLELGLEKEHMTKQRVEQYVLKLDAEAQTKFKSFLQNSFQNPHTLFVLIHDHAHWDLLSSAVHNLYAQSDPSVGLVDRLLNCREVKEAANIVTLHVTSFPYALQTQHTLISPYNEIHWPASYSNGVDLYPENKKYFGLSEFIESTLSGHSLPLLRYDSSFEAMVTALGKRFPRLHSAVIRTFVLVQHYAAAMMAVSGLSQMKNYTSVETLEITQNLINSPKQCPCGHGLMVLLRVPCSPLAAVAYERLAHVRARLALEEHFEIILGNPSSGISVGKHFVKQLKMWQKIEDAEWRPQTYLELEGLPCILIFSGMDPHGESLPRSLRYCDLRLINSSCLVRTALEQELGLAAYFVSNEAPLEKGARHEALESDGEKLSSTDNEDEELVTDGSTLEKRSPVKRERSCSHDSASSSLSSKASSSALCGESSAQPGGPSQGERARSPQPCGPSEESRAPGERQRLRANRGPPSAISRHSPGLAPQPDCSLKTSQRSIQVSVTSLSSQLSSSGSSSSCTVPAASTLVLQAPQCSMTKACQQPPIVFLPKLVYDMVTSTDSSGLPKAASLLPSHSVMWASSFRPLLSKTMTSTEQSLYYRQWTVPRPSHMDYGNRAEGRVDSFHPRRLLLSGPPQIGKTGAYLQFLSILSRMLIRLTEVDVYDEEEININFREESDWHYVQLSDPWPDLELFKKLPFDYIIHDPKYEDASLICSHHQSIKSEDRGMSRKPEDLYVRRHTARMRLSKYAAYNTYHHCEQCHQYMGFHPRYQLYESTLHAFAFSYSMLGEEIQLHFIIPKSKEHHFVFSQPGGQLESMRLPLVTDKSHECIKSPTFTPTTGRHEHGLFNLYHAMDGASHLHVLVVKEYEMAIYKKYWPNHIMLVLPSIFNSAGVGAAHFLIKELSYHNLELERNRQEELGIRPQDIWPFIVISDDSCVMWNVVDVDGGGERSSREFSWSERNVSLKHIMQHIEASPNITHYALIGMRKWSSKTGSREVREPFSRCHVHDFVVLNVDLTQNVQYNQNRFTCDDVDFNLRVHSAGLLLCRFNRFSVMKKQIAVGGHRSFHITSKVADNPVAIVPAQYICAPDSKHTFLAAPAQLLLEKFLQHHSHRFFPLSLKNHGHPVLSVDCYLNLGSQISVCYVSSRPHSLNISCSDFLFSGLLLYLCDSFVGAGFLKKFHFLKGATLCVICQDRNSLRQTVVRLELEDEWQFRLRDEFQTANAKEDRPLFFLTGRHI
ncbi:PREDICTED: protein GREB1 isoform X1 [Ceratotherium simum simum]|uniref:Protein GREB1 isoform X1 n=1 Tax=Ceratotherium simum simum TaxID=73337 RepID=A0ABM1D779_CERSS|nr:PREDICTED: protein GREB1 isoform X1 [Ceratotherium simum simum]XP_014647660.1 PREDICTED: protein GREB1 isoform X1 [Ceratotherium simum simum]